MLSFYKQQVSIITLLFWVLVFSFLYLVLFYQTNRTYADIGWVDGSE